MATVIIGGLISSTLLEFLVRPALFWKFGTGAADQILRRDAQSALLRQELLRTGAADDTTPTAS